MLAVLLPTAILSSSGAALLLKNFLLLYVLTGLLTESREEDAPPLFMAEVESPPNPEFMSYSSLSGKHN